MPTTVMPSVRSIVTGVVTIGFVNKTIELTTPADTEATDVLVCFQYVDFGSLDQGGPPTPGGWTERMYVQYNDGDANTTDPFVNPRTPYMRVWTAKADVNGSQTYTITVTDERADHNVAIVVVKDADPDDPVDDVNRWWTFTTGNPQSHFALGVTTTFDNELVLCGFGGGVFSNEVGDYTAPAGFTKLSERDTAPFSTMMVASLPVPTAGATGFFTATYAPGTATNDIEYVSTTLALKPAKTSAASAVSSSLGVTNTVTTRKKVHAAVTSTLAPTNDPVQRKAVALDVANSLALTDHMGTTKDVRSVPRGGPIDLSLWAIDDDGSYLGPLPDVTSLDLSPVVNDAGSIRLTYPRSGLNFELLHDPVIADRDREVAIWVGGREVGSLRAVLNEASGDEVGEDAVWTFTGTMLNGRMAEAIVYPNAADEKQETHFNAATAGTVMATLMQQAHDRGALADIGFDFNATIGSNGKPFSKVITMAISPGTDLFKVLGTLVEFGLCEWEVSSDHKLRVYEPETRGKDLTLANPPITLRRGNDLLDSPRQHSVKDASTALLVAGKDGLYHEEDDNDAQARRGRRIESYDSQGNIDDAGSLTAYAQAALTAKTKGVTALSQGLSMVQGNPLPIADFDLFDWIYSDNGNGLERYRVVQWTISQDKDGRQSGAVQLNDTTAEWAVALAKRLADMQAGSAVVGTSAPADTPDTMAPAAPTGVTGSAMAYQDAASGNTYSAVTAGWTAVTTNADGTFTDDVAGYRVRYRYTGLQAVGGDPPPENWGPPQSGNSAFVDLGTTTTTQIFFSGLQPALTIEIQAQAFDRTGNVSAWSAGFVLELADDEIPPPAPSIPTVTQNLGVIRVEWDGLDHLGVAMPPDFQFAEIHASVVKNFTPTTDTLRDKLFGASSTAMNGFLYGAPVYVKLVALDLTGNRSDASDEAQVTPEPIFSDDLFDGCVGEEKLADLTVKEAHVQDAAIGAAKIGSVNAGSITSGIGSFDMLLAGRIRTADHGARIEMDNFSFRQFGVDDALHTEFRANDGTALITGEMRSALSGKRWVMSPDGTLRLYPAAGANFASIQNNVTSTGQQEIVLRGPLTADDNQWSGYLRGSASGVAVQYGTPGYDQVLAQLSVKQSNIDVTAPVVGLRADYRFSTADGTQQRIVLVHADNDPATGLLTDIPNTALHHVVWTPSATALHMVNRNLSLLFDNTQSGGFGSTQDAFILVYGDGNLADLHCGNVFAPNVTAPSGIAVKRNITEIPYEPLEVVRSAPAMEWEYDPDLLPKKPSADPKPFKVRRQIPGTPQGTGHADHFEWVDVDPPELAGRERKMPRRVGPIADQIAEVAPQLVQTMSDGSPGLGLGDLVGVLWKAVERLSDKVDELTAQTGGKVQPLPGKRKPHDQK